MQEDAVELLVNGVVNVMRHLGMLAVIESQIQKSKSQSNKTAHRAMATAKASAAKTVASTVLTKFEWVYTKSAGMWYPKVAPGDVVKESEQIGMVGDLFGDTLEKIISPVNGVILFLTINPSVLENGLLMGIGVD
jgi:predicted deacylase